jgi:hypothetical protein
MRCFRALASTIEAEVGRQCAAEPADTGQQFAGVACARSSQHPPAHGGDFDEIAFVQVERLDDISGKADCKASRAFAQIPVSCRRG